MISYSELLSLHGSLSSSLLENKRFSEYCHSSDICFAKRSSYYLQVLSDLPRQFKHGSKKEYPFIPYSRLFLYSAYSAVAHPSSSLVSSVPFYDLIAPVSAAIGTELFPSFREHPWFPSYLDSVTLELTNDLSDCLSHVLYEMFTRTLSLGKTINRFYHPLSDSLLAPRAEFDSFVISTLDSCFVDIITSYPMSLYFIGQSIACWYHRHLELLDRFNCRFEELSGFSPASLKSLSFSTRTSGDNHNFNRRSYILTFVLHNNDQSKICYKPRSTANDLFFYNLTQEFVVPKTDLGVSLPETFDYGEYGLSLIHI